MLDNFPLSTGSYLISTSHVIQNVLHLSSFSRFICLYLILLYVKEYDIFLFVCCFGVLFVKLTGKSLTASTLWSGSTLLGIYLIYLI